MVKPYKIFKWACPSCHTENTCYTNDFKGESDVCRCYQCEYRATVQNPFQEARANSAQLPFSKIADEMEKYVENIEQREIYPGPRVFQRWIWQLRKT